MNRYRVSNVPADWPKKLPYRVGIPGSGEDYGLGEEFEHEFTVDEEADNLASGLLEIVPREYRVIAEDSVVHDTPTGGTFVAALLIENEAALLSGGHIERVDDPPPPKQKKKKED